MDSGFTIFWVVAMSVALAVRLAYFAIDSGDARGFHVGGPGVALVLLLGFFMSRLSALAYLALGVVAVWLAYELAVLARKRRDENARRS